MIAVGKPVPTFSLSDDHNEIISNESLKGAWTILYFYPKDDTTGCTAEACSIRDFGADFGKRGVNVYGVSKDSVVSHTKFKKKYDLNFPLLADTEHALAESFGVWQEKMLYGKKYMGMERSTFVLSPQGKVVAAFPKVNPVDHGMFLLKELDELMA